MFGIQLKSQGGTWKYVKKNNKKGSQLSPSDNEYLFLDLKKKLSNYFGKRWKRSSSKVDSFESFWFFFFFLEDASLEIQKFLGFSLTSNFFIRSRLSYFWGYSFIYKGDSLYCKLFFFLLSTASVKQQVFLKLFLLKPSWLHVTFGHAETVRYGSFFMLSYGRRCCSLRAAIRKLCSSSWLRALFKLMLEMWNPDKNITFFLKIIFLLGWVEVRVRRGLWWSLTWWCV